MKLTIDSFNANFVIDDSSIRFIVHKDDANSFVSLVFSAESSSLFDPYTYQARLDGTGFSAGGRIPQSQWSVTSTDDSLQAFLPFGTGGEFFDMATAQPPDSLFVTG